jgi:hypothetical protein
MSAKIAVWFFVVLMVALWVGVLYFIFLVPTPLYLGAG